MSTDNNYRVNAIYDRLVTGQATAKHDLFHFKMHQHNNNDGFNMATHFNIFCVWFCLCNKT